MSQNETGGRTERSPHLTSNDVGNGGLPQSRGTIEDRVIECFIPLFRRLDTDPQGFFHPLLANILLQSLRTQDRFDISLFVRNLRTDNSLGHREGTSLAAVLFLLRRWKVSWGRRQSTLPWRWRATTVRRADLTPLGRIRKVQLHLLQLTLGESPPIPTPAARRHRRASDFTIPLGTGTADSQQISP